jgi:hypothetical protein
MIGIGRLRNSIACHRGARPIGSEPVWTSGGNYKQCTYIKQFMLVIALTEYFLFDFLSKG